MPYPFHLMIKPAGPACNLDCSYCYYTGKAGMYPGATRMDETTLERVTAAYLQANPDGEVIFSWQGGEPLLMGLDFFRQAILLQQRHARPGQRVQNALQTNGTLVTSEWAGFLAENQFLVGVSLDGPAAVHDRYRVDRGGHPTHAKVIAGLQLLLHHEVEVNALVTVNRHNMTRPLEVYRHLTEQGLRHLQFIPIVERTGPGSHKLAPWSVRPEGYGNFLCSIFDYWVRHDVGRVFVQLFESALGVWLHHRPGLCVFEPVCGRALVAEHNGDLYACDHFVYPEYRRGEVTSDSLAGLVDSPQQRAFGQAKADLSVDCRRCPVLPYCNGDCPKHRVHHARDGKPISVLCPAYRRFFTHSGPVLQRMAREIRPQAGDFMR